MKVKKLAAFLLCLSLLVGLVPIMGATAAAENAIAYVNQATGDNSTAAINNSAKPYKSISDAIKALDVLTGDVNRVIMIQDAEYQVKGSASGDYRGGQANDSYTGFAAHTNMITITGENGTANKLSFPVGLNRGLGGPIILDNITYEVSGSNRLHTLGHALTVNASAVAVNSGSSDLYVGALNGHSVDSTADEFTITMNGGEFGRIILGDANKPTTFEKPIKLTVNGGKLARVLVGYCFGGGTSTFAANVNVVLNNISFTHSNGMRLLSDSAFTNGATLQVVMNNGLNQTFTNSANTTNYYLIKVAKLNGVTLDTTAATGVYKINGNLGNNLPVVKTASGTLVENAYDAQAGTITVPTTGEYKVEWEEVITGDQIAYVNQATGNNDTAVINDNTKPYKSINAAISALDAMKGDINRIVKIQDVEYVVNGATSGDYWYSENKEESGFAPHVNPITITGANGTANKITFGFYLIRGLGGPITLDNITYSIGENRIYTLHESFTIGSGVLAADGTSADIYVDAHGSGFEVRAAQEARLSEYLLTMNAGTFKRIIIGATNINTTFSKPTKVVINGGSLERVLLGNGYSSNVSTFEEDVNIIINGLNGNQFGDSRGVQLLNGNFAFANGAALQVVMNNGINQQVTPGGYTGGYYLIKAATYNGVTLDTTAEAGTYKIVGNIGKKVPVVKDANGNEVQNAYDAQAGTITVPTVGTYTVAWANPKIDGDAVAYVDAANGDDAAATIGDATKAFETINAAITALDESICTGKRIIKIAGVYTIGDNELIGNYRTFAEHTNMIIIEAVDGDDMAEISFEESKLKGVGGPVTLNLPYRHENHNQEIYFHGYEVILGEKAISRDTTFGDVVHGNFVTGRWHQDASALYEGPHKLTVYNASTKFIRIGHSDVPNGKTYIVAGADILLLGGESGGVWIGGNPINTQGANEYTANINITVNGGLYKRFAFSTSANATPAQLHKFKNGAAVQLVFNNGMASNVDTLPTVEEVAALGGKLYVVKSAAQNGSYLEIASTGVYTVRGGKTAVAVNEETGEMIRSVDGVLNLSAAPGVYSVSYSDSYALVNGEIVFFANVDDVRLDTLPYVNKEDMVFVGWKLGDVAAQNGSFTAGQILTPVYVDGMNENFAFVGSSIRLNNVAIRYVMQVNDRFYADLAAAGIDVEALNFGTVVLPAIMLKGNELLLNTVYSYNGNYYESADVPRVVDFAVVEGEYAQYTAALYNIPKDKYKTNYAVRGYVTYADINGNVRTAYTEQGMDSLYNVAERLDVAAGGDESAQAIMNAATAENRAAEKIICWGDSITQGMNIDAEGKYPTQLQGLLNGQNFEVVNAGGPGENSLAIIARQGGVEAYTSNEIVFAEGVTKVKLSDIANYNMRGIFRDENGVNLAFSATLGVDLSVNNVVINGEVYTISYETGEWYLLRESAASSVTIAAGSAVLFASEGVSKSNYCDIYYMGANDGFGNQPTQESVQLLIARIKKAIEYRNDDCYLVVIPHWTNEYDDAFVEAFGDHAVNLRDAAVEAGYEPIVDYYGTNLLNSALNLNGESYGQVHLSAEGYTVMANAIYARGQQLGYWN